MSVQRKIIELAQEIKTRRNSRPKCEGKLEHGGQTHVERFPSLPKELMEKRRT